MHAHIAAVEVALVDLDLVAQAGDVGNIDTHRAVFQRLHELVVLKAAILRLIGVADNHFVDVGLRELLGLDLVLLAGAEQVVQEGDIELEHFDELNHATVGDVELTIEVKRARVAVGTIDRDLAVVDIAGQLGRVLILLVFRLEGANADAILLGEDQTAHPNASDDLAPVAATAQHLLAEVVAARGAQLANNANALVFSAPAVELANKALAQLGRDEVQRVFVHGARLPVGFLELRRVEVVSLTQVPVEGVECAIVGARVVLKPLFQAAHNRRLRRADRSVEQQHALFGAIALRGGLEEIHQAHQGNLKAKDCIVLIERQIAKELVADQALLGVDKLLGAVRHNHVVDALKRISRYHRILRNDIQILTERTRPVQLLEFFAILHLADELQKRRADLRCHL